MKITVINGTNRHGSTWHCVDLLKQEIAKSEDIEVTEFFLPNALPYFCNGCFSCFMNGEHTCPHADYVSPLVQAMTDADVIVITSPVYGLDVSGQLKAFFDHLCFMWFTHRPNPRMFNKVAVTFTTTAGAGLNHTTKTMKNNLIFWGVKKTFTFKKAVAAIKWEEVPPKREEQIKRQTIKLAKRVIRAVHNVNKLPNPVFRGLLFFVMSGMMKKNIFSPVDKAHWEAHGWLSGNKPF